MTTYQLIYLRYLRICADFPELNHRGQEPLPRYNIDGMHYADQRAAAEREFYRPIEQPLTSESAHALETQSVSNTTMRL